MIVSTVLPIKLHYINIQIQTEKCKIITGCAKNTSKDDIQPVGPSINSFKRAKVLVHHQASSQILDCIQVLMSVDDANKVIEAHSKSKITRYTGQGVVDENYDEEHVTCCRKSPLIKTSHQSLKIQRKT